MLVATEFSAGTIGEAAPLTLILPRSEYDPTALIGRSNPDGNLAAFFVDDNQIFQWFECPGNHHWKGILVPDVIIEVDETTVFDPEMAWPRPGCVVRQADSLVAIAKASSIHTHRGTEEVILLQNLSRGSHKAAFTRWQVSLGQGADKRILHTVDANK